MITAYAITLARAATAAGRSFHLHRASRAAGGGPVRRGGFAWISWDPESASRLLELDDTIPPDRE